MDLWEIYKASKGVPHSGDLYDALMGKSLGGGSVWETENAPYLFRRSGGTLNSRLLGKAKDKLVGASVAFNQLVNSGDTSVTVTSGHKYYANINNSKTIGSSNGTAISINDSTKDNVIDLTLAFGSAIADYAYTLESGTAGAGIAWLKSYGFFSEDYYGYDSGSLQSVNATAHIMRDGNDNIIGNYPLADLDLRGIFKMDASHNIYADGDTYESSGVVTRKYGVVDLGTLKWSYQSTYTRFNVTITGMKPTGASNVKGNAICPKYVCLSPTSFDTQTTTSGIMAVDNGSSILWVRDLAYTDPVAFKATMSGVYLVYELATPTTETATPFTSPQSVSREGTEQYIDGKVASGTRDVAVPVGHETEYKCSPIS